ncbi:MAG: STAS domain-containing protein [Fimbriimonadaceae bacterium]|nr:STAS domain-containing protein [Fimbriimonadaceae bacterium]
MATDSSQPLRVEVEAVDGVRIVRPSGEVDIASVVVLQEALNRLLDDGATRLVVNLEGLDYLDSTGIGCVTAARRRARDLGGDVVLVCTRERVLRLFKITGLDQVFSICASGTEALAKLKGN